MSEADSQTTLPSPVNGRGPAPGHPGKAGVLRRAGRAGVHSARALCRSQPPGPLRNVVPLDTAGRGAGGEGQPHRGRGPALARLDALLGDPMDVDEG